MVVQVDLFNVADSKGEVYFPLQFSVEEFYQGNSAVCDHLDFAEIFFVLKKRNSYLLNRVQNGNVLQRSYIYVYVRFFVKPRSQRRAKAFKLVKIAGVDNRFDFLHSFVNCFLERIVYRILYVKLDNEIVKLLIERNSLKILREFSLRTNLLYGTRVVCANAYIAFEHFHYRTKIKNNK